MITLSMYILSFGTITIETIRTFNSKTGSANSRHFVQEYAAILFQVPKEQKTNIERRV